MNKWHTKEEAKSLFKDSGNDLIEISLNYNSSKLLDPECSPYLTHYHNLLKGKRDKPLKILEIGVKDGDSLKIWKEYFHSDSKIYGIEINPESVAAWVGMGLSLNHLGLYRRAIEPIQQAARLEPNDATIHAMLAQTYLKNRQYVQADTWYQKAIKMH